tara:strand:+ start:1051 stop:2412 length:1362 start_codon:yes stop_codon:yes gene_type:complete
MKLIRSISGIRGIIGTNFNEKIAAEYAKSFSSIQPEGPILIGRDTRNQGTEILTAIKESLTSLGRDILDCDIAPTPVIQFLAKELDTSGAIMVTASHNPEEWNGLKFIDHDGCFIDKYKNEKLIYNIDNNLMPAKKYKTGQTIDKRTSISLFIDALLKLDFIDTNKIKNQKFKVVVDTVNGANYHLLPYLLKKLNCDVIELFCNSSGIFERNPEPLAENLNLLCKKVTDEKADLGLASDPDGDRLSIVDNKGHAIGEESTLVLCADTYYNEKKSNSPLVTNLSSSMCLDFIASKHNVPIFRSAIGEANVIELMKNKNASFGGEGNGGVILKDIHLGRDSLVATIMILNMLAKENKTLDQIMTNIPNYYMIKEKVDIPNINVSSFYTYLSNIYNKSKKDTSDGLKLLWKDKWLHIRSSNTEPVIRIIAESSNLETTKKLIKDTIKQLKKYCLEN